MTILGRYIFKEFIKIFLTALIGILIVYLCLQFLQRADWFIRNKASISHVAAYFLYNLPSMTAEALPISSLIAALLSLGNLSRYNELIAMRASGVSLAKIISPVLAGGLLISAFGFVNNEFIMPVYTARASHIKNVEIEKKTLRAVFQHSGLWLRGPENSIANIDFIPPDRPTEMLGVNIYKLNPDYTVRERIRAESLEWENNAWRFKNSRKYTARGDAVVSRSADGEVFNIVESPNDLGAIVKSSEEMNFSELWDYVKRLKNSGYKAIRYEVELHGKLAFPLSSLLMVMIAAPLSIHKVRSGGAAKGFAFAVFIAFIYWTLMSVGTALGRSGALPPVEAAWLANIIFAVTSLIALYRSQRSG